MIYPSHWTSYFGIENPDTEPYKLVDEYSKKENELLANLRTDRFPDHGFKISQPVGYIRLVRRSHMEKKK